MGSVWGSEKEARLWLAYRRTGEVRFRNELVMLHVDWAESICRAFARNRGFDWHEVWGDAAYGLICAVELYDPARGLPFRALAEVKVKGAVREAARQYVKFRRLLTFPGLQSLDDASGTSGEGSPPRGGSAGRGPGGACGAQSSGLEPPRRVASVKQPASNGPALSSAPFKQPASNDPALSSAPSRQPASNGPALSSAPLERAVLIEESGKAGKGDGVGDATRPRPLPVFARRPRDPADVAEEREARSRVLDAMPDEQAREVAYRRIFLFESVDEIGIAMGLGKSRVQEILGHEVLPRARRVLIRIGIGP